MASTFVQSPNVYGPSRNQTSPKARFDMGGWLTYRRELSYMFLPPRWQRDLLRRGTWNQIVIPFQLDPQQTLEFNGPVPGRFAVKDIMVQTIPGLQIQALLYDQARKRAITDQPIISPCLGGNAERPFYLRRIYPLAPRTPVLAIVTNLSTSPNAGQIVLDGSILPPGVDFGDPVPGETREDPNTFSSVPPWVERPASGESFTPSSAIPLQAAPSAAVIVQFQVPNGRSGVLKWLATGFEGGGWQNGDGNLVWQILINGAAVKNYDKILTTLGSSEIPFPIAGVRLRENDVVQLSVQNKGVLAAGQRVFGLLSGWYYPKDMDPASIW